MGSSLYCRQRSIRFAVYWGCRLHRFAFLLIPVLSLLPAIDLAQQPAAIVEEIDATGATLSQFDYVVPGRVIDLEPTGTLTLGYLASCERERIQGGTVTVGLEPEHGRRRQRQAAEDRL